MNSSAVRQYQVDVAKGGSVTNQKASKGMVGANTEWPRARIPVAIRSGKHHRNRVDEGQINGSADVQAGTEINGIAIDRAVSRRHWLRASGVLSVLHSQSSQQGRQHGDAAKNPM